MFSLTESLTRKTFSRLSLIVSCVQSTANPIIPVEKCTMDDFRRYVRALEFRVAPNISRNEIFSVTDCTQYCNANSKCGFGVKLLFALNAN